MNALDEIRKSLKEIEAEIDRYADDEDFQALLYEIVDIGERFLITKQLEKEHDAYGGRTYDPA